MQTSIHIEEDSYEVTAKLDWLLRAIHTLISLIGGIMAFFMAVAIFFYLIDHYDGVLMLFVALIVAYISFYIGTIFFVGIMSFIIILLFRPRYNNLKHWRSTLPFKIIGWDEVTSAIFSKESKEYWINVEIRFETDANNDELEPEIRKIIKSNEAEYYKTESDFDEREKWNCERVNLTQVLTGSLNRKALIKLYEYLAKGHKWNGLAINSMDIRITKPLYFCPIDQSLSDGINDFLHLARMSNR